MPEKLLISKLQPSDSVKMTQDDLLFLCIVKGAQDSGQARNIWFEDGHTEIKEAEMKRVWFSLGTILMDRVGNDYVRWRVHVRHFAE